MLAITKTAEGRVCLTTVPQQLRADLIGKGEARNKDDINKFY